MINQKQITQLSEVLCPTIPESEIAQAINARFNQDTSHLREADLSNPFGSRWAEITARMAAERLGWRLDAVKKGLEKDGNNAAKTEQNNAAIVLLSGMKEKLKSRGLEIAKDERVNAIIRSWACKAVELGCSEQEAQKVTQCLTELQINQLSTGKIVNNPQLVELLVKGIKGETVEICELHCVTRKMTLSGGFEINPDMVVENRLADGSLELADQGKEIDGFMPISHILRNLGINHQLRLIIMDLDAFILDSLEVDARIATFDSNLRRLLAEKDVKASVERASKIVGVEKIRDFKEIPEVESVCRSPAKVVGERQFEKLVDELFEKNSGRDLPPNLKTRQASREFAALRVAIEISMGKILSGENRIFVQRATTKSASDLFLEGAKSLGKKPPFLFFWVDRWNH